MHQLLKTRLFITISLLFVLTTGCVPAQQTPAGQLVSNISTTIKRTYFTLNKLNKITALVLSNEIGDSTEYIELVPFFLSLTKDDVVNVYLKGTGGSVDGAMLLGNLFRNSPAQVNIILMGDVYSAHAVLALQGDSFNFIDSHIRLMFHEPATGSGEVVNTDLCKDVVGTDRGHPAKEKCEAYIKNMVDEFNETLALKLSTVLTKEQYAAYLAGNDVYVQAGDIVGK